MNAQIEPILRTIDPELYVSEEVFALEKKHLLPFQLFLGGHSSEFTESGQFRKLSLLGDEMLICGQPGGQTKALANRCLHRGASLVASDSGKASELQCPYHAWRYGVDGVLLSTRGQLPGMEKKQCLHQYPLTQRHGLNLVSLKPMEKDGHEALDMLSPYWEFYGIAQAEVVARRFYSCEANWKIVTENFLECFHCAPCHPQLADVEGHVELLEEGNIKLFLQRQNEYFHRAEKVGHRVPGPKFIRPEKDIYAVINGVHLSPPRASGTKDGMLQGTLLGRQTEIDHGFLFGSLGPFIHFSIYSDYAVFFNFIPQSATSTQVETSWIANSGLSTEQVETIAWLWHHTIQQDCRLCEFVQEQAGSSCARQGFFTDMEADSALFSQWYQRKYKRLLAQRASEGTQFSRAGLQINPGYPIN